MKSYALFILLVLLSSCSRKSEEQLIKEAETAQEQKNFQIAVERYQELADRYSQSARAETSLYRIALIYNNDLHDVEHAVEAYRKFYTSYPESKDAPTAMFLRGFIFNNELHKIDSAKVVYEAFLQHYPRHELATSARFELETLGKDPGQFITPETGDSVQLRTQRSKKFSGQ